MGSALERRGKRERSRDEMRKKVTAVASATQRERRVHVLEKEVKDSNNNQREAHVDTKGPESAHKHACMKRKRRRERLGVFYRHSFI